MKIMTIIMEQQGQSIKQSKIPCSLSTPWPSWNCHCSCCCNCCSTRFAQVKIVAQHQGGLFWAIIIFHSSSSSSSSSSSRFQGHQSHACPRWWCILQEQCSHVSHTWALMIPAAAAAVFKAIKAMPALRSDPYLRNIAHTCHTEGEQTVQGGRVAGRKSQQQPREGNRVNPGATLLARQPHPRSSRRCAVPNSSSSSSSVMRATCFLRSNQSPGKSLSCMQPCCVMPLQRTSEAHGARLRMDLAHCEIL